jgi:hypothetical protein
MTGTINLISLSDGWAHLGRAAAAGEYSHLTTRDGKEAWLHSGRIIYRSWAN